MSNFNASDNTGFSSSYLTNITEVTNESSIRRGGSNGHGVGGTYADDDSAVSSEVTIDEPPAAANRSRSRTQSIESTMEEPEEAVQLTRALETDTNSQANNDNNNNAINTMEQERAGILPRNRREWCIVLFAVFMIVAVATGVGLGLGLFMSNRNGTDTSTQNNRDVPSLGDTDTAGKSNPSRAPTSNGPTASSSPTTMSLMGDYDGDSFSDAIEYHLIAQEISSIASFRDVAGESEMEDGELTAQQQARDFLVFNDFLPLGLDDEDDDTEEEVNGKTRRIKSGTPYLKASHPAYRVVQRFVAATLYFSTNGTQWFDSNTWVEPGVHECEWLGITCEEISIPSVSLLEVLENPEKLPTNKNGRIDTTTERMITEINLPENNLGGYLPQEIMALPYLQMLGLWSNMIGGALPTQLGNLAKLQTVHLEDNEFTGSIPTEIGLWAEISKFQ